MEAGWGKDSSRMEVVGMYCLKEMRKDNLVRHNAKIHQGKKEAFSFKTQKGQRSLSSLLSVRESPSPGKALGLNTDQEEPMDTHSDEIRQLNIELAGSKGHDDKNENVKDLENNWPGAAQRFISNTEKHEASAPFNSDLKGQSLPQRLSGGG